MGREVVSVRKVFAALSLFLAATLLAGTAGAATFTDFVVEARLVSIGEPEREWQSDGILHVRGQLFTAKVKGDLGKGTFLVLENYGVDLARDRLVYNHGTWVLETDDWSCSGTYAWAVQADRNPTLEGRCRDGSLLKAEFVATGPNTAELRGAIH